MHQPQPQQWTWNRILHIFIHYYLHKCIVIALLFHISLAFYVYLTNPLFTIYHTRNHIFDTYLSQTIPNNTISSIDVVPSPILDTTHVNVHLYLHSHLDAGKQIVILSFQIVFCFNLLFLFVH